MIIVYYQLDSSNALGSASQSFIYLYRNRQYLFRERFDWQNKILQDFSKGSDHRYVIAEEIEFHYQNNYKLETNKEN